MRRCAANTSPFSPPVPPSTLAPANPVPTSSSSSSSTQPLLAEIFSGRPRPHFRSSTSYSHASSSTNPDANLNASPPAASSIHAEAPPSYFAAPAHRPQINRARSQSSAPTLDSAASSHRANRTSSPIGMSSNLYGAPGSGNIGLSQSFAADQHGWRPSQGAEGTAANHFSASVPTTSAVGSPTFSSFANHPGAAARDLSPSSPSSRALGYSPFARPSSSLASGPPSAKPGAFLSQSFSTGWEDFEREREGRARVRDTWIDSASSLNTTPGTGLSPFSRDSSRLTEETTSSDLPIMSSSVGAAAGDTTWGVPTGLGPGGVYKARRDYSLGAVGSGRKRSDSAWGGTRDRILREQDEDDEDFASSSFAPPTKSGATSRRHSFAAFEAPFGRASQTVGFHLPEEVHKEVGGLGAFSTSSGISNGLRMGGMGSSAIDDDDLAADLNSLHLSLDAHAKEQQQQSNSASTTTSTLHVGSMPVDFPPARSRRFDTSRSPPDSKPAAFPSTASAAPSHGLANVPGSPRATAEPFTPSLVAPAVAPAPPQRANSNTSSVASRFFQAPSPLPPTTTNAVATATPGNTAGGVGASRFDFFGMPFLAQGQQQPQQRYGLPPPTNQAAQGFYNSMGHRGGPPPPPPPPQGGTNFHRQGQGPPPALGSTFSPFAPSPFQSPVMQQPPPPLAPHMMNGPPHPSTGPSSYFAPVPPPPPPPPPAPSASQSQGPHQSQSQGHHGSHAQQSQTSSSSAAPLTSQSQSDMSLGRGVPLHAIPPDAPLCIVGFKAGRKDLFFCEDPSLALEEGDLVIVEADRGRDVGKYLKRCSIDEVHKFQQHMVELALGQLANPASMTAMGFGPGNQQPHHSGGGGGGGQSHDRGGNSAGPAQLARMTKECQPKRIYAKAGPADTHALLAKAQDEVKALQLVRGKVAQKGKLVLLPFLCCSSPLPWSRQRRKCRLTLLLGNVVDSRLADGDPRRRMAMGSEKVDVLLHGRPTRRFPRARARTVQDLENSSVAVSVPSCSPEKRRKEKKDRARGSRQNSDD